MPEATLRTRPSELVKYEEGAIQYSRDQIILATGNNLTLGAVLGIVTASGEYAQFDPAAVDGSEIARAVLIEDADASLADVKTVALRRHCVVSKKALVWKAGTTDPQKAAALAQLEAIGIVARDAA
jgi:hypothetical protein